MVDALIARPLEVLDLQSSLLVGLVEFARAAPGIPFRPKRWKRLCNTAEIRPVATLVRPRVGGKFDATAGHGFLHNFREVANLVILLGASHVESLIVNHVNRCVQGRKESARNIFDVHDRAPRSAIALDEHSARRQSPRGQIVKHKVKSESWRNAVSRGVAEESRAKV